MTDNDSTGDEAAIRAVIDNWVGGLRNKKADQVIGHCADGLVLYSLAPPLRSLASGPQDLYAWFATWLGPIGYDLRDLKITVSGDLAFSHSINHLSGTKVGGEKSALWFRHTLCFRKFSGQWKIVHEHESVPFYMDGSYKAAIDLEP